MDNKTIRNFSKKYVIDSVTNCWVWTGAKRGKYGIFRLHDKVESAHRASYQLHCEAIPKDMVIRHVCDNTLCVNPAHLTIGTNQENYDDRTLRFRFNCKLNGEQVLEIYNSTISNDVLANRYNVGIDAIKRIKNGKAWKDYIKCNIGQTVGNDVGQTIGQ